MVAGVHVGVEVNPLLVAVEGVVLQLVVLAIGHEGDGQGIDVDGGVGVPVGAVVQEESCAYVVEEVFPAVFRSRAGVDVGQAHGVQLASGAQVEEGFVHLVGGGGELESRGGGSHVDTVLGHCQRLFQHHNVDGLGGVEGCEDSSCGIRQLVGIGGVDLRLGFFNSCLKLVGKNDGGGGEVELLGFADGVGQGFYECAQVDVVAQIGQVEVVDHGPVVCRLLTLLDANLQRVCGHHHLYLLVHVALVQVEAAVGVAVAVGIPVASLAVGVAAGAFGGHGTVENRHQGVLHLVGVVVGADGLGAVVAACQHVGATTIAVESLQVETIGAVGQVGEGDAEVDVVRVPALLAAAAVHAAVAALHVVAAVPAACPQLIALVVVGQVGSGDEPRGVHGIGGRGLGHHLGEALLLGDQLPRVALGHVDVVVGVLQIPALVALLGEEVVLAAALVVPHGAQHLVAAVDGVGVAHASLDHGIIGLDVPSLAVASVDVVVVGVDGEGQVRRVVHVEVGLQGVGAVAGHDFPLEATCADGGTRRPVFRLAVVVLQPQSRLDVVEVELTLCERAAHPGRTGLCL